MADPKHILIKDNGNEVSKIIADNLEAIKNQLQNLSYKQMYKFTNAENLSEWNNKQALNTQAFKKQLYKQLSADKKTIQQVINDGLKSVGFNINQRVALRQSINTSVDNLGALTLYEHQKAVSQIMSNKVLKTKLDIFQSINDVMLGNKAPEPKVYADGKTFRWETYTEMKLRTDVQHEISNGIVDGAYFSQIVFMVCSTYGDCAKDHQRMQDEGLFYVEGWEQFDDISDEVKTQIADYIDAHKLHSVQYAMGDEGDYFTTRPNCRHYFQYIPIDDVLNIKTKQDLQDYRENENLALKGSYKPQHYEALQKQRYNERRIRYFKENAEKGEIALASALQNNADITTIAEIKSQITRNEAKVRQWQSKQRDLMNTYEGTLVREYKREAYQTMIKTRKNGAFRGIDISNTPQVEMPIVVNEVKKPIYEPKTTLYDVRHEMVNKGIVEKEIGFDYYKNDDETLNHANMIAERLIELNDGFPLARPLKHIKDNSRLKKTIAWSSYEGIEINPNEYNYVAIDKSKRLEKAIASKKYYESIVDADKSKYKTYKKIIDYYDNIIKFNGKVDVMLGKNPMSETLIHEYGHIIADQYFGQINGTLANKKYVYASGNEQFEWCKKIEKLYKQSKKNGDIYKLSEYGSQDKYEFFAEMFTQYHLEYDTMPKAFKDFIDEVKEYGKRYKK